MKSWQRRLLVAAVWLITSPTMAQIELDAYDLQVTIDPGTLAVTSPSWGNTPTVISAPQANLGPAKLISSDDTSAHWELPNQDLRVAAELDPDKLVIRFKSGKPGTVTWPIIPASANTRAFILPHFEGVYAPTDDGDWRSYLSQQSPMDTTASLSMPFIGLDLGHGTLTYIFENIFDNKVEFRRATGGMEATVTHSFMPNWQRWQYSVVIYLGDDRPIAPALAYREYLIDRGEFVTMAEKIEANPKAKRLLGAPQAYLWDAGLFSHLDATDWKGFAAKLIEEGGADEDTLGKRIWESFNDEAREAAVQITTEQWPYKYIKAVVAAQVSEYLAAQNEADTSKDPRAAVLGAFVEHFAGLVRDPDTWGDGISKKMIDRLQGAGLDRMLLCLGDLSGADLKPQVAAYADELGYLFGPYDSYHSIHNPDAHPDSTWETAQFGRELYETGGIVNHDGSMSAGFKKVGYHLSPSAARPHVEKRVNGYMSRLRLSAVFVDCDAYGQFFDDYHPDHTATKQQDMLERLDRLDWLNREHGLVVGSEGGSGYAAPVIHFAHGMLTRVIGWGDPDFKDRNSPYYKGAYWPPNGPTTFTRQVPLKPKYKKFFYDPRYRLPLYQAVFHDSVIATHHWGNASLKFEDQIQTVAILEQLYNVPPLYHLNLAEFKKHQRHILAHYSFFSPLHRNLALQPMTDFAWLTDDRMVQQTIFGDGTRIIANFGDQATTVEGHALPARSVLAVRPDGTLVRYSPGKPSD